MPNDVFMSITGISGNSQDETFRNQFEVMSLSYGLANPYNPATGGPGGGAGKASFTPITITLYDDKSPLFLKAVASSQRFERVVFSFRTQDGRGVNFTYETITLTTAGITQMQTSSGGERPVIELSFAYATIEISQRDIQRPNDPPIKGGWDLVRNKAL